MKLIKLTFQSLWKFIFLINFIVGLLVLYPLFFVLLSNEKWFHLAFSLKRFWARWILFIPGIRVSVKKPMPSNQIPHPCVYCANHTSYLDIVVSYVALSHYFVYMAKQELNKAPLFRIFFKKMNILVDRKSKIGSHKAFMQAAREIDKGHSVFLFPEGTISSEGIPRTYKNGPFKLAIEKQVPIVPITFLNNYRLLQNGGFFKAFGSPGTSRVIIHEPVDTKGMSAENLIDLRSKVYEIITTPLLKK